MLYTDFYWKCPSCNKGNWETCANEDEPYECEGCKREFLLTFSVEVEEVELYDRKSDSVSEIKLTEIEVSKDSGETWEKMTVNTRDLNPETSPIKDGWLLRHNGQTYKAYIHPLLKRIQTEKVAV